MPFLTRAAVCLALIAFAISLPRRHGGDEPLRTPRAEIAAVEPASIDCWYKTTERLKLEELPIRPGFPRGAATNGVEPAWGMFTAMATLAVLSVLDHGHVVNVLLSAALRWVLPA